MKVKTSGPATKLDVVVTATMNMMVKNTEQTISKLENKLTTYADWAPSLLVFRIGHAANLVIQTKCN